MRTALNGILADAALPTSTTGTLASSMPSVVPSTTATSDGNRAASTTVATCVLSPISARKNATTVTPKTPQRVAGGGSSASSLSGRSAQSATAKNDSATSHRSTSDGTNERNRLPRKPASAWLASVATRMPAMIGSGFRKRAASTSASNCVLSPISPSATTPVETRKASMGIGQGFCVFAADGSRNRRNEPRRPRAGRAPNRR